MLATATPEAPKSVLATHAKPAVIMLQLQLPSGTRLGIGQAGRGAYVCRPCAAPRAARRCSVRVAAYLPDAGAAVSAEVSAAFKRLQNGSDIRGVALSSMLATSAAVAFGIGKPEEGVTLTPAAVFFIAASFVDFLKKKGVQDVQVAVGNDPRISAPLLGPAVLAGLLSAGAKAVDVGLATTPAMFYGIVAPGSSVNGSIMLTASHMPYQNNGMKFFTAEGGLAKPDITEILAAAAEKAAAAGIELGDGLQDPGYVLQQALAVQSSPSKWPLLEKYAGHLRQQLVDAINHPQHREKPLMGLKIAVDAGNGSGGFFASQVLEPLGADTTGSQFLQPDGTFPNHIPNPENKEAMAAAVNMVKSSGAQLGIIFDTDVDRSAVVDGDGSAINSNKFIALMAAIVLQGHPGSIVVTDSVTSNGLTKFIEARGGKHLRFKRGYKNVISKGVELNNEGGDCELMMETSGHGAMRSNRYLDDGCHLALQAIIALVRSKLDTAGRGGLSQLLEDLQEPADAAEYRIKIKDSNFKEVGKQVLQDFHDWVQGGAGGQSSWSMEAVNYEGWRVAVDEGNGRRGWLLLRQSLHDPLLVLNVESDMQGGVAPLRQHVLEFLQGGQHHSALDLSSLVAPSRYLKL